MKQEAHWPHRSPEQKVLVTFFFIAFMYVISFLNFEPLSGAPVLVRGLWLALTTTLFEDPCIVISQTVAL